MPRKIEIPSPVGLGELGVDGLQEMSSDAKHRWVLLRTKGRQERSLALDLTEWSVPYFLPLLTYRGANNREIVEPMFPGYMFLFGTTDHRYTSLRTNRVVQVVDVNDQSRLLDELIALESTMSCGYDIRVVARLVKGDICLIRQGPMGGTVGTVDSISDDNYWVAMYIHILGQSVLVKVPRADVQLERSGELAHV